MTFPPELVIEAVSDKSKKFNSESRIKIKNIGKLPALNIESYAENLCINLGGISLDDCLLGGNAADLIHRLSGGESTETKVTPGISFGQAVQASRFEYTFILKYEARLLVFRKRLSKKWKVELRTFEDGFSWNVTPTT